jgi:hypothetical protein
VRFLSGGLVLVLVAAGCRTRLFDDEGAIADASAAAADAAVSAQRCDTAQLVSVALRDIGAPDTDDAGGGNRYAATIRVLLTFPWRPGCDIPGQPTATATVDLENHVTIVTAIAHLWRSSAGDTACGPAVDGNQVLVLSDLPDVANFASARIRVVDGAPGGTASLELPIQSAPLVVSCDARPVGQGCDSDCQCRAAMTEARCIPCGGGLVGCPDGVFGHCAISCAQDADCPDSRPSCSGHASVPWSCGIGSCMSPCPRGQVCVGGPDSGSGCHPPPTAPSGMPACTCSDDCGPSGICTLARDPPGHCVLPCATDADCPATSIPGRPYMCVDSQCLWHG